MTPPVTGIDWNAWREAYPSLTFEQQRAFYSDVYREHPLQHHFNKRAARRAIKLVQPRTVIELGGWDGELAHLMLEEFPSIEKWTNVEICEEAARSGSHPRYEAPILDGFYWEQEWEADLFVASHTIEHLTASDLEKTIAVTSANALYLDAPLSEEPDNWSDYHGSHILGMGWKGVRQLCAQHGYWISWSENYGGGRACLFQT